MEVDKETKAELTDAEHIRGVIESQGWALIKAKLDSRILDLQNINNLDTTKPLEPQIFGRQLAAQEFFHWLKNDVYGRVEQAERAAEALQDKQTSDFVDRG